MITDEVPLLVRIFNVGQYECTMSFRKPVKGEVRWSTAEWSPHMPPRVIVR